MAEPPATCFPAWPWPIVLRRSRLGVRITFVGTGKPFERQHVLAAGHEYLVLPSRPFSRHVREALLFLADNVSGYYAARRFLAAEGVTLVVGLGGYASAATTRAAKNRSTFPTSCSNKTPYPGKATRWLAGGAELVCAAFPTFVRIWGRAPLRATGTPVRRELLRHRRAAERRLAGGGSRHHSW